MALERKEQQSKLIDMTKLDGRFSMVPKGVFTLILSYLDAVSVYYLSQTAHAYQALIKKIIATNHTVHIPYIRFTHVPDPTLRQDVCNVFMQMQKDNKLPIYKSVNASIHGYYDQDGSHVALQFQNDRKYSKEETATLSSYFSEHTNLPKVYCYPGRIFTFHAHTLVINIVGTEAAQLMEALKRGDNIKPLLIAAKSRGYRPETHTLKNAIKAGAPAETIANYAQLTQTGISLADLMRIVRRMYVRHKLLTESKQQNPWMTTLKPKPRPAKKAEQKNEYPEDTLYQTTEEQRRLVKQCLPSWDEILLNPAKIKSDNFKAMSDLLTSKELCGGKEILYCAMRKYNYAQTFDLIVLTLNLQITKDDLSHIIKHFDKYRSGFLWMIEQVKPTRTHLNQMVERGLHSSYLFFNLVKRTDIQLSFDEMERQMTCEQSISCFYHNYTTELGYKITSKFFNHLLSDTQNSGQTKASLLLHEEGKDLPFKPTTNHLSTLLQTPCKYDKNDFHKNDYDDGMPKYMVESLIKLGQFKPTKAQLNVAVINGYPVQVLFHLLFHGDFKLTVLEFITMLHIVCQKGQFKPIKCYTFDWNEINRDKNKKWCNLEYDRYSPNDIFDNQCFTLAP